ncbi:hypothetical protein D3C86_1229410 [compost metagenome]
MAMDGDGFGLGRQQHGQQRLVGDYPLDGALADQPLGAELQGRPPLGGGRQGQHVRQQLQGLEPRLLQPRQPLLHLRLVHRHQIHVLPLMTQHHQMQLIHVGGDLLLEQIGQRRSGLTAVLARQADPPEDEIAAGHQGHHGAATGTLLQLTQGMGRGQGAGGDDLLLLRRPHQPVHRLLRIGPQTDDQTLAHK